ncbi:NAD(P)H-binding protein [Pseudomaricurvus alkylphenolicus]|jgi:NAD(P)H dehydrogenase (quinone)|uniref:NAD(P)H-binding protein n=1 Tax=Pseudomaricurvus alkylphenolicus TaxID=1306991 RepID=UPI00141E87AC|nr:NAD(P)H-binding protein [Pseudomaricurvus alkylphenolicus]NIB42534.1 NAD(P)H-binding protein [Pseudomaricurvus alkylphenolicus]
MILVCAASGRIGRRVLKHLITSENSDQVVAGARVNPQGVDANFRIVNYDDVNGMVKAFEGVERVVFIPSFADTDRRAMQGRNVVAAAERAGVSQILFIGIMDTRLDSPLPFARAYGEMESALLNSPVPAVILRTSMYTDNLAEQYPVWLKTGQLVTCAGSGRVSYVSRDDIAASIVGVLRDPVDHHRNRIYKLTGPEALSYADVAGLINELHGSDIKLVNVNCSEFADRLKDIWGVAYEGIEHVARVTPLFQTVFRQGMMSDVTSDVLNLSGRSPESAQSWLGRHQLNQPM